MPNHTARLYAVALTLVVFFLAWAVVAARPWSRPTADPRLRALTLREAQLRRDAKLVDALVAQRWATYRVALAARRARIAAAAKAASAPAAPVRPAAAPVRVVTLPPVTITRTS